ncbi:hypothetical protein [Algivirga pacifica]|uniref:Lipocalin-like domain-containing protein n=1 Tax=Algivirga pacifica TaxID=1162670 RepID=A0ABP9DI60_9BACT
MKLTNNSILFLLLFSFLTFSCEEELEPTYQELEGTWRVYQYEFHNSDNPTKIIAEDSASRIQFKGEEYQTQLPPYLARVADYTPAPWERYTLYYYDSLGGEALAEERLFIDFEFDDEYSYMPEGPITLTEDFLTIEPQPISNSNALSIILFKKIVYKRVE